MRHSITFREKLSAWWRGFTDSKRDITINPTETFLDRNLTYLTSKHREIASQHAITLRENTVGLLDKCEKFKSMSKPTESNDLGQTGRNWHNYLNMLSGARTAIDQIIRETEICRINIAVEEEHAQTIIDRYVATVKKYHPRRAELTEWKLSVPNAPDWYNVIDEIHKRALEILTQLTAIYD